MFKFPQTAVLPIGLQHCLQCSKTTRDIEEIYKLDGKICEDLHISVCLFK